jgi:predicted nucleotidyltransferase
MQVVIKTKIEQLEQEEQVRILYACESGSRAWGFASTDSDYDVRFIYCHPTNWYLSINDQRDVLERPLENNIDLSGWDIRKALRLFRKSNPPLLEWLDSPILYQSRGRFAERLKELLPQYYSPRACLQHYWHMAQGNFDKYLGGDLISQKRYFYVLRPVLACKWIEASRGAVPMKFATLVNALLASGELKDTISALLPAKMQGLELDEAPKIPIIHSFLSTELARLGEQHGAPEASATDPAALDELFRVTLEVVW